MVQLFMDQSCPWTSLAPSTLQWCEQQLCAWVREPSNTYSNLIYIIVGLYILYDTRKFREVYLKVLGYFSILLGFMSGFYHASGSLIGELFDFSAMFLFSSYFITAALARLYGWGNSKVLSTALILAGGTIAANVIYPLAGPYLFASQMILSFYLEFRIWKQPNIAHAKFKNFIISFLLLQLAFVIWNLDRSRIVCDPDNHWISGHAIWHILTGFGALYVYKFYSQFRHLAAYDSNERK